MKNLSGLSRNLIELLALLTVILVLFLVIQLFVPSTQSLQVPLPTGAALSGDQPFPAQSKETPLAGSETAVSEAVTKPAPIVPYPPPGTVVPLPSTPSPEATLNYPIVPVPETPALTEGQAATLHNGDIWLVETGVQPKKLTNFADVFDIFDWNRDGNKLLFGRGSTIQAWGYTTDLWLLDLQTGQSTQMTNTALVKSASWSPVDDRLAYCEYGNVLKIIDLDGKLLNERKQALCMFTWSPEGEAIAVEVYTPDMLESDGLAYTVLGIWWLLEDRLQVFSDAKDEVQASPVWSMDGQRILFIRSIHNIYDPDEREQGLYIADVLESQIQLVRASPTGAILGLMRSPQADLVVFRMGTDIYEMDFEGNSRVIGRGYPGSTLNWLLTGQSLIQREENGEMQVINIDGPTRGSIVGGWLPALRQLEYLVRPGGNQ